MGKNAAVDLAISVCSQQVAASGGSAERLGDTVKGISAAIGGAPTQDLISAVSKGSFEVAKSLGGSYEQALAASAEAAFSAAHSFNMSVGRSAAAAAEAASALGGHESELTDAVGTAVGSYASRRKMKPTEAAAAAASAAQVAAQVAFTEGQSTKEVVKLSQTLVTGLGGSPESATAVSAVVAVPPVLTHQLDAPVAMDSGADTSPLAKMEAAHKMQANASAHQLATLMKEMAVVKKHFLSKKDMLKALGASRLPILRAALSAIERDKEIDFWRDDVLYGDLLPKSWSSATKLLSEIDSMIAMAKKLSKSTAFIRALQKKMASLAQLVFTMQKAIRAMRQASFTSTAFNNYKFNDDIIQKADSFAELKIRAAEHLAREFPPSARSRTTSSHSKMWLGPKTKGSLHSVNAEAAKSKAEGMAMDWMNDVRNEFNDAYDKHNSTLKARTKITGPWASAKSSLSRIHAASVMNREAKVVLSDPYLMHVARKQATDAALQLKLLHNEVVEQAHHKVEGELMSR